VIASPPPSASVTVLYRPAFKPYFHVERVEGEGVFLLSEHGHFVLFGPVNELVAPAIDGRRTSDEIVDGLVGEASMQELYLALASIERDGYLIEADAETPRPEAAFWAGLGAEPREARSATLERTASVRCLDSHTEDTVRAALEHLGVRVVEDGDATLVVADDYLNPELARINDEHMEAGRPWLLVKPRGFYTWIGPLFAPGRTACWRCLEHRLRGNREVESFIERRGAAGPFDTSVAATPASTTVAIELAALHLSMCLADLDSPVLESRIVTANWAALDAHPHTVLRRPQCPCCGDSTLALNGDDVPPLRPTGAATVADGGLREVTAEATYARYQHLISPITGVVSGVTPAVHVVGTPIEVYVAGHNFALKNESLWFLQDGLRTISSGKGRTAAQARASALCEAVERYSGVYQGDEKRIRARYCELGERAIHPNDCMLFSDEQFRDRDAWMARNSRFQLVPLPFDPDVEIEWSPLRSLATGETRHLPTGYLYYGYPMDEREIYFWSDSNGNAAGNTLAEAELQGFLELAERDAVCVWWYNRLPRPAFDLESLGDPYVESLVAFYAERGRELWVLDLTNDLGIPVFIAINRRIDHPVEDIVMGFGAHLDARTAVSRALAEMNQFMPAVHQRDDQGGTVYAFDDPDSLRWWQTATLANQPYLGPHHLPARGIGEYPELTSGDVGRDLMTCVGAAAALGHETFVLNQTRADIGLPVAKVVVPGLRHFWARLAPGRLYDAPVRLGWLPAPLEESQLNPIAMFL
jgi:bacteriocin biosynthesis cyclodehydratase domain-containing protein